MSSSIKPLGGNRYQVSGKLTLKGITRELSAPFTATSQGKAVSIDGTLPISRLAFKIGEGSWSDTGTVADNVDLRFRLVVANP
ncbi:YceI-like domain protein [compost metagenome]